MSRNGAHSKLNTLHRMHGFSRPLKAAKHSDPQRLLQLKILHERIVRIEAASAPALVKISKSLAELEANAEDVAALREVTQSLIEW